MITADREKTITTTKNRICLSYINIKSGKINRIISGSAKIMTIGQETCSRTFQKLLKALVQGKKCSRTL